MFILLLYYLFLKKENDWFPMTWKGTEVFMVSAWQVSIFGVTGTSETRQVRNDPRPYSEGVWEELQPVFPIGMHISVSSAPLVSQNDQPLKL